MTLKIGDSLAAPLCACWLDSYLPLSSRQTGCRSHIAHVSMWACHEITPHQIITDAIRAIFWHSRNLFSWQHLVPHVHAMHFTKEAPRLVESTSKPIILILTKDHNSIIFYHVTCFEAFIAIGHSLAIDVEVPRSSGVLPRCADVVPMVIIDTSVCSPERFGKITELMMK